MASFRGGNLTIFVVCCVFTLGVLYLMSQPPGQALSGQDLQLFKKYKQAAFKWRKTAGEVYCSKGVDEVGPTGGWCLVATGEDWGGYGKAAKNHVKPDEAFARVFVKYLPKGSSLYDVGAGVGQYGHWFKKNNIDIVYKGYDGAENVETFTDGFITWTDATDELFDQIDGRADWVMSLEVGEHIAPEATHDFIRTLDRHNRKGIMLSWAVVGQAGHSHINCKNNNEVIALMKNYGYTQDDWALKFQAEGRAATSYFWFQNTFMVFKRAKPLSNNEK